MSAQQFPPGSGAKKAVHVKWAGKTIALGTFPAAEADEKCARAKALTRAWRSTMRPKPSREWVMLELERLDVRVVSGRLGRKGGEDGDESEEGGRAPPHSEGMDRKNSIGWNPSDEFDTLMQRRSSSLGFRSNSLGLGVDDPSRRPFVGGGSAAAYEAARADHYSSLAAQKGRGDESRLSTGGGGSMAGGAMGMSVNPNQHYEMLKLHHMNLLNEIQETTLMMNLYQQQQLQQQQQQLQHQGSSEAGTGGMMQSPGVSGMDPMYGGGGAGSYGQRMSMDAMGSARSSLDHATPAAKTDEIAEAEQQQKELEERLQKIKDEIARKQKEAKELEASDGKKGGKRKAEKNRDASAKKQAKKEKSDESDDDEDDDSDSDSGEKDAEV